MIHVVELLAAVALISALLLIVVGGLLALGIANDDGLRA